MTFGVFVLLCFVLNMVLQLTPLEEKSDSSQEQRRWELFGCPESQRPCSVNDSGKPRLLEPYLVQGAIPYDGAQ